MTPAGPVTKITEPEAMLDKAAAMEVEGAKTYNQSAIACAENADAGSRQIFEQLVADEEIHFDRFERQRDHIRRFGPSYLALQSFDDKGAKASPAG